MTAGKVARGDGCTCSLIRLAAVNTPEYSGLLDDLLSDFAAQTGYEVDVYSGEDVYEQARAGNADLVLSHYGHAGVEAFVTQGFGLWPRAVFANQVGLVGSSADRAHIGGLADAAEAFSRIAATRSSYVVNDLPVLRYTENTLWEAAGRPDKGSWYMDEGLQKGQAMMAAAERGAYTMWGIFPFLRFQQQHRLDLQPMVLDDPLLQRIMVTVVLNPDRFLDANVEGATALQQYLLTPATQARIRTFRIPELDHQLWWPAGRHNNPGVLP